MNASVEFVHGAATERNTPMSFVLTSTDPILPLHHPHVLLETAERLGAPRSELLQGTGIDPSAFENLDARISYQQYGALIDNALRLTGEPALGLLVGQHVLSPQMGVIGFAIMISPTMRDALGAWIHYVRALSPAWDPELVERGSSTVLVLRETLDRGAHRLYATEALVSSLQAQARALLGRKVEARAVRLAFPRPAHAARYAEVCDAPMTFGHSVTEVELDQALLDAPIGFTDPATWKAAHVLCAAETTAASMEATLLAKVRAHLQAQTGDAPTIPELAKALDAEAKHLRATLRTAGFSFRDLVREARQARARDLVRSTQLPAKELASRLGFRNVRSFRRAFKLWTGMSPDGMRRGESE